jgi:uncharacterized membrane protein
MSEATLVNLITAFDVLLVGGLMLVLPRIMRRGLLFGVYVGEKVSVGEAARRLNGRWLRGTFGLTLGALALGLWLGFTGRPLAGCLGSMGLLCIGVLVLYVQAHRAARELAPPRSEEPLPRPAAAMQPGSIAVPLVTFLLCLGAGTAGVIDVAQHWPEIPEQVPTHFGVNGEPDAWASKSFASVFAMPLMNLVMGVIVAGMALLIARAPLSLRRDPTPEEKRAQLGFRRATVHVLSGVALLCTALLGVIGCQSLRTALGERRGLGSSAWWLTGLMLVFTIGYTVRLLWFHGQGGSRREGGSAATPLTDGLADDRHWKWGVFYINRDDPAVLVEKRFGVGYTVNFGNPMGLGLMLLVVALLGAVTGLSLWGASG